MNTYSELELQVMENKKGFVEQLGMVLNLAKPHLVKCEYFTRGEYNEYVAVTCENGYQYIINVSADSLAAIAKEVFEQMLCK